MRALHSGGASPSRGECTGSNKLNGYMLRTGARPSSLACSRSGGGTPRRNRPGPHADDSDLTPIAGGASFGRGRRDVDAALMALRGGSKVGESSNDRRCGRPILPSPLEAGRRG